MKKIAFVLLLFCAPLAGKAQEVLCNLTINADRVRTQERQIFEQLQQDLQTFLNTQKWTQDEFQEFEKIRVSLLLNFMGSTRPAEQAFAADAQVQSLRPVYGTNYETAVLVFFDNKFQFRYNISDPLIFAENTFTTELTSLLAYYMYIVIGMDYDTFSPLGGSPFYERALNILNNAQQGGGQGWNAFGDTRDRYWLVTNLLNPQFEPFRQALYEYHRLGLDVFEKDPDAGREAIFFAIEKVKTVFDANPVSILITSFFNAKVDELVNVFQKAPPEMAKKAEEMLSAMNPVNSAKYKRMLKQ